MAGKRTLIILVCALMTGCASLGETKTEYIKVCPEAPLIERPELEVLYLNEGDTPDVVIQAHRLSIKRLQKWGLEQEAILDGYRKKDK